MKRTVHLLRAGEIVALPTETVYGLAADATNALAVAKIFDAKERPRFDPLITHLPTRELLKQIAHPENDLVFKLIDKFWPGPLTILLRKQPMIPGIVTAGLDTVAVRMSAHPLFVRVAEELGQPISAPSANRFGRVSPTEAQHVLDELGGRIPLIIDAGPTPYGLESTIVRVVNRTIEILRHGPVTTEMLAQIAPVEERPSDHAIIAPGQSPSHYAPRTKLILVESFDGSQIEPEKRVGALRFGSGGNDARIAVERQLSEREDLREAAANLFRMLRELDQENVDFILARLLPEEGLGVAINDRLRRAAAVP